MANYRPNPVVYKTQRPRRSMRVILLLLLAAALIAGAVYYYLNYISRRGSTPMATIPGGAAAAAPTASATAVSTDPYAFLYETSLFTVKDAEGNVKVVGPSYDPENEKKLDEFFGPLPKQTRQASYEHVPVRGLYIKEGHAIDQYIDLVAGTEINAFVVDIKESYGIVFPSTVPLAIEMGAGRGQNDIRKMIEICHSHNIRFIARIVCFKDEIMAQNRPDLCISNANSEPITFPLENNMAFANPYNKNVWYYLIDLAKEVIAMGADEIQFDYVRFPTGGSHDGSAAYYGEMGKVPEKYEAINRFLQTAVIEIQHNLNTPVGADLFSNVMTSVIDGELIGQNWKEIGMTGIDNICPMIYPSHYANSSNGVLGNGVGSYIGNSFYEKPDLDPYGVIRDAMIDGEHGTQQPGYAPLRPYLQAFTASYLPPGYYKEYSGEDVRQQIQAVYDSGFQEWILWNAADAYPEGSFLKIEEAGN